MAEVTLLDTSPIITWTALCMLWYSRLRILIPMETAAVICWDSNHVIIPANLLKRCINLVSDSTFSCSDNFSNWEKKIKLKILPFLLFYTNLLFLLYLIGWRPNLQILIDFWGHPNNGVGMSQISMVTNRSQDTQLTVTMVSNYYILLTDLQHQNQ